MKVEHILRAKGADVFSILSEQTIADAVAVLNDKNIGAVIVKDADENVVGILSERDIVRQLGRHGAKAISLTVGECMTPEPFTCGADATVDEIMAKMTDKRIRHLPVINDEKLIGVVSIGDVVKRKIEQAVREAEELKKYIAS